MCTKPVLPNPKVASILLLVMIVITMLLITGTLGRYLFSELRPVFWYGLTKTIEDRIRVVDVEGQDIIFSNGERINGHLMMPYNITAGFVIFFAFCFVLRCEFYLIKCVFGFDVCQPNADSACPRVMRTAENIENECACPRLLDDAECVGSATESGRN